MMKTKKKILYSAGIILLILLCVLFVWLFPYIKAAGILQKAESAQKITYDAFIHINSGSLSKEEKNLLDLLEQLLVVEEEDLLNLHFSGEACEEYVIADIYCQAFETPITEIYYSEDQKTLNLKMLYDTISQNLADELWLLKIVLPQWEFEEDYVTFEQLKETFGVDMETLIPIGELKDIKMPSMAESVYLLSKTSVEKDMEGNHRFTVNYKGYAGQFSVVEKNNLIVIQIEGRTERSDQKIGSFEAQLNFY